ncbi:MAG: hypothetical protein JJE47_09160 [Acidimicrobiia bacterium]|nr:hypothetical protein [Acidimicrobiia bacterium]
MIVLSQEDATITAIVLTLVVAGWGMATSVISAVKGPAWGVGFIMRTRRLWLGLVVVGLVGLFLVDPQWLAFVVAYLGASAWWLGSMVRQRTSALLELGEGHAVSSLRQGQILRWTGYGMGAVAAVIGYAAQLAWERFPGLAVACAAFAILALSSGLFLVVRSQRLQTEDQME